MAKRVKPTKRRVQQIRRQSSSRAGSNTEIGYENLEERRLLAADLGIASQIEFSGDNAYLQQGPNDIQLVESATDDSGSTIVLQQTYDGVPIHGAYVTVTQDANGATDNIFDNGHENLTTLNWVGADIGLDKAKQVVEQELGSRLVGETTGEQVWFFAGNRARMGWQVEASVGEEGQSTNYSTIVDAHSGTILNQEETGFAVGELLANPDVETSVYPRITINDTIGAQGSRDYAASFDSVVSLDLGCTGTLVAPDVVISARHCGASAGDTITFGDNSNSGIHTATVQSVSLPDGNGSLLDGGDVAILNLTANVPTNIATPMRFIDATTTLEGMTAATIGYGYNGLGSSGHGFSSDGWRWGGENVIDVYGTPANNSGSNIISTDFDDGSTGANTISGSSVTPLPFEATTAPGDSGGPVLVQSNGEWLIAGVLSGGTTQQSTYGDVSWWTGTAVYKSQIEAAGGVFTTGGGTSQLGTVSFDQASYLADGTVNVTVTDQNAVTPLNVTLTSASGDSETLTLSGSGSNYSGSISLADSGVNTNDGTLQVSVGDAIQVSYADPNDGNGGSGTVTDDATITEQNTTAALVGIDFDGNNTSPSSWTTVGGGNNATFANLGAEDNSASTFDLSINESADGSWESFDVTPAANTIPQHSNSLANINGQIYTGGDSISLTYSDLTPNAHYEIFIFSAEGFYASIQQRVTIQGDGAAVTFDQDFNQNQLFVNDQVGDSSRELSEYAQTITADASGNIVITVDPITGTQDVVLAGVAISEVITPDCNENTATAVGAVNNGVAVTDSATGSGYIMYSAESVHTRFGGLNPGNADHMIGVRFSGGNWQYNDNNNNVNAAWTNFTPESSDQLIAEVDFSADTIDSMQGTSSTVNGINAGYTSGNLTFTANQWGGNNNSGEFGVSGTFFDTGAASATTTFVSSLNNGVAVTDNATGTGFVMYSAESVHTRFGGLNPGNADHLIAVRHTGSTWQYNDNFVWVNFTPVASDHLLADMDFSVDTVVSLQGSSTTVNGINSGYASGDLVFTANQWAGNSNAGEFGVSGTYFDTDPGATSNINITPVRNGVAVTDNATGTGHMMYSAQSVHTRFGGLNPGNADHLIGVRFNGGNWQYNSNLAWINFTPDATDLLVADLDFSADTATSLLGTSSVVNGINAGYVNGDLAITVNQWNGVSNAGEFGVSGTFISTDDSCGSGRMAGNHLPSADSDSMTTDAGQFDLGLHFVSSQTFTVGSLVENVVAGDSGNIVSAISQLAGANNGLFETGTSVSDRDELFASMDEFGASDNVEFGFEESLFEALQLG